MKRKEFFCFFACLILCFSVLSGCQKAGETPKESSQISEVEKKQYASLYAEMEEEAQHYAKLYLSAKTADKLSDLNTTEKIMECLSKGGDPVGDIDNQLDMKNAGRLEKFCADVEAGKSGKQILLRISIDGTMVGCFFQSKKGEVTVYRCSVKFSDDGTPQAYNGECFQAIYWEYTRTGYLLFEQYHPEGFDGSSGHEAIRVAPLDEACRIYNRKYILPIGYDDNEMFYQNWSSKEGKNPEDFASRETEPYYMPYPEVVSYKKDKNGDIILTVNAVWAEKNLDCAFAHQVRIRVEENGTVHYLSNNIIKDSVKEMPQ